MAGTDALHTHFEAYDSSEPEVVRAASIETDRLVVFIAADSITSTYADVNGGYQECGSLTMDVGTWFIGTRLIRLPHSRREVLVDDMYGVGVAIMPSSTVEPRALGTIMDDNQFGIHADTVGVIREMARLEPYHHLLGLSAIES